MNDRFAPRFRASCAALVLTTCATCVISAQEPPPPPPPPPPAQTPATAQPEASDPAKGPDTPAAGQAPEDDPFGDGEIMITPRNQPPAREEAPAVEASPPPLPAAPKDPTAAQVPAETLGPYVLFEDQEAPDPETVLGWIIDEDTEDEAAVAYAQALLAREKWRLAHRVKGYQRHEAQVGMKFIDFETRHVTGHFQTTAAEALECARLWERLAGILRKQCGRDFLPIRPMGLRMVVCENEQRYIDYLKFFRSTGHAEEDDANWWKLARQSASFGARNLTLIRRDRIVPPRGAGLPHMAVFSLARMQIRELTDNKAPAWFAEGFSSLSEFLVLDRPLCYSIRYEYNPLTFEADWAKAVAKGVRDGKTQAWEIIFTRDLIGMSQLDYQQCWSMVRFLFESDPKAFARLPALFRKGQDTPTALQGAYGKSLKSLETAWARRALTGR